MFEGGVAYAGSYHGTRAWSNSYLHARADCHPQTDVDAATHGYAIAGADRDGYGGSDQRAGRGADASTREFGDVQR